jgi:hypothetical protein
MAGVLECVLGRRRDPAGDDAGRRRCRVTMESSFSCRLALGRHVRRCARGRKKGGISRESVEVFYRTGIGGKQRRGLRTPASNFFETRTSSVLDPERNERGEEGGLRAVLMAINCEGLLESGIDFLAVSRNRERER